MSPGPSEGKIAEAKWEDRQSHVVQHAEPELVSWLQFWMVIDGGGTIQEQLQVEGCHHAEPPAGEAVIGRKTSRAARGEARRSGRGGYRSWRPQSEGGAHCTPKNSFLLSQKSLHLHLHPLLWYSYPDPHLHISTPKRPSFPISGSAPNLGLQDMLI